MDYLIRIAELILDIGDVLVLVEVRLYVSVLALELSGLFLRAFEEDVGLSRGHHHLEFLDRLRCIVRIAGNRARRGVRRQWFAAGLYDLLGMGFRMVVLLDVSVLLGIGDPPKCLRISRW